MRVHAMSRERACHFIPHHQAALISISTPRKGYITTPNMNGWAGVLPLSFHDVTHEDVEQMEPYRRFNLEMATAVVHSFSAWNRARPLEDLFVHCDAGYSRSVAIAVALHREGFGRLFLWETELPSQLNRLVLSLMQQALREARTKMVPLPAPYTGRSLDWS